MIVRIHPWRVTWRYLLVYFIVFVIAFVSAISMFFALDANGNVIWREFGISQGIFIAVFAVLFLTTYLMAIRGQYYIIENKYFIVRRLRKEYVYDYSNIIFLDVDESKRKKMVIFYTKKAGMKYLLGDKDSKLLDTLIKKCPNTLSREEFRRQYPQERY